MLLIKHRLRVDDSLDAMAVHGLGGILGTLLAAVFALDGLGGVGLAEDVGVINQLGVQALGVVAVVAWTAIACIASSGSSAPPSVCAPARRRSSKAWI